MAQRRTQALALTLIVLCSACANLVGLTDYRKERDADGTELDLDAATGADAREGEDGTTLEANLDAAGNVDAARGSDARADAEANHTDGPALTDSASASEAGETDGGDCGALSQRCGDRCVPTTDPQNCGRCGHDCTQLPHVLGSVSCNAEGQCVVPPSACVPGFAHCSTDAEGGCELDLSVATHCGGCTTICGPSAPLCSNRGAAGAPPSYDCVTDCTAIAPTKCGASCVDTTTSLSHCSGCDKPCSAPAGGTADCSESRCVFECNSGFHRCGDACARNDSVAQCGAQCLACPQDSHGTASCVSGDCKLTCASGYILRSDRAACVVDTRPPCITKPSQVVIIGDGYFNYHTHSFATQIVSLSGQTWRNLAILDAALGAGGSSLIAAQYRAAVQSDPDVHAVIMDGSLIDVVFPSPSSLNCKDQGSSTIAACKQLMANANNALNAMFDEMVLAGIPDVIYVYYPQLPSNTSAGGSLSEIIDYNRPIVKVLCENTKTRTSGKLRCTFVNLASVLQFNGDIATDGTFPNSNGSQAMANAIWGAMTSSCIGQTGGPCCRP